MVGLEMLVSHDIEIIGGALIESRHPWCRRTWISQTKEHGYENQNYIERLTWNLFQSMNFIINLEGVDSSRFGKSG